MRITNLTLALSLILTGCGSYGEQFDCPIGSGLKCASLSEVNQKIDDGTLPLESTSKANCPGCQKVHWREDLTSSSSRGR